MNCVLRFEVKHEAVIDLIKIQFCPCLWVKPFRMHSNGSGKKEPINFGLIATNAEMFPIKLMILFRKEMNTIELIFFINFNRSFYSVHKNSNKSIGQLCRLNEWRQKKMRLLSSLLSSGIFMIWVTFSMGRVWTVNFRTINRYHWQLCAQHTNTSFANKMTRE